MLKRLRTIKGIREEDDRVNIMESKEAFKQNDHMESGLIILNFPSYLQKDKYRVEHHNVN